MKRLVISLTLALVGGYFILAQESPAPEPDIYRLTTQPVRAGDKYTIEESSEWSGNLTIITEDGPNQIPLLKKVRNNYVEEIIEAGQTIKSRRIYRLSQVESNLPEVGIRKESTSLEGKTLVLQTKGYEVSIVENLSKDIGAVLKEDRVYLGSLSEYNSLLPETGLKVGDTYVIKGKAVTQSIFREYYNEETCLVDGKGKLEEVINNEARISFSLKVSHDGAKDSPAFEAEITGSCLFSLAKNILISLELSGPFRMSKEIEDKDTLTKATTEGELTIKRKMK